MLAAYSYFEKVDQTPRNAGPPGADGRAFGADRPA